MKGAFSIILHPFLLSLWVTLLLLPFLPVKTPKFKANLVEKGTYPEFFFKHFDDLDGDGNSEMIAFFHNSLGSAGLTVSNRFGVLDQWNFRGTFNFSQKTSLVMTSDCNNDSIKEIYLFTLSYDTILLHIIPDYRKPELTVINRFVAKVGNRNGKLDPYIIAAGLTDLTGDERGELVFAVGTGYSIYPRRLFAYDAVNDSMLMSPESGNYILNVLLEDMHGDGQDEIIPLCYAACNVHDPVIPYPDTLTWLMVLDRNLNFIFEPVPFPGAYANLLPAVYKNEQGDPVLAALYCPPENLGDSNLFYTFDAAGHVISSRAFEGSLRDVKTTLDKNGRSVLIMNFVNERIDLYDAGLKRTKSVPFAQHSIITLTAMETSPKGLNKIKALVR